MSRYLISPLPPEDTAPPSRPQDFNIPDEAYGARKAFDRLQPGEGLGPDFQREIAIANATRASELQNQFLERQREILATGPDAYLSTRGRDALLGADATIARLDAAREDVLSQAANATQRELLSQALADHRLVEHATVSDHVGQQTREWRAATAAARLDQLGRQAALDYGDPGAVEAYDRASQSAAQEKVRASGWLESSDEAISTVGRARSSIWRQAIEAALGKMELKPAIALYERGKDRLAAADRSALSTLIGVAHEHEIAREYVEAIAPIAYAPQTPADIDDAHEEASARSDADWGHDPELRATIQHLLDVLFGKLRVGGAEAEGKRGSALDDWLSKRGEDGLPQTALPPPAIWAELDPERQQAVRDILKRNAEGGANVLGRTRPRIIPVSDKHEEDETEEVKKEIDKETGKFGRRVLHDLDETHIRPHEIPQPLAPYRPPSSAVKPSETPTPAPKTIPPILSEGAKPPVSKPQTPAEKLSASRGKLKQLDPSHPEVSGSPEIKEPSLIEEALVKVRNALKSAILRIYGHRGRNFEARVLKMLGLNKNTIKVTTDEGSSIPDALTDTELIEIKDRAYVTMTRQLCIQAKAAKRLGLTAVLYVRKGARVSAEVRANFIVREVSEAELPL
ncbi:hypothetical protein SAMN02745126_03906 [Enhydrobacter aerosaccus]|uniref:Tox-REase-7 domain-containing protein n=1 Tax=Enhydrobacter aerosaccus TaxID=225324 RepID=A0A1T4RM57_9HYPH|nr:putative toxin [Enhydrobacter aerosaccus]SKA16761.1 hypothetical protein SAMN02745126_03906 [Enhydrobacter aerosaccus]